MRIRQTNAQMVAEILEAKNTELTARITSLAGDDNPQVVKMRERMTERHDTIVAILAGLQYGDFLDIRIL